MKHILARYVGQTIGVNFEKPDKFEPITLLSVDDDLMSLHTPGGRTLHYSTKWIVYALEGDAVLGGGFVKKTSVSLIVQVHQFLVYKGGGRIGFGLAF